MQSIEFCAGAGGQALGLEQAGFEHAALVEIEADFAETLRLNRPHWNVLTEDMARFDGRPYRGVDLFAGGLPCPPFSVAGKQLGARDDRNLFPAAIRLLEEIEPRAILIENVKGILSPTFADYRENLAARLSELGYRSEWKLLNASQFGVPQLRPRAILVGMRDDSFEHFEWPEGTKSETATVGDCLYDLMSENDWRGASNWKQGAMKIAPTLVGGSKKHGGPDLGPTRARAAWAEMGVEGKSLANGAPDRDFEGMPRLTLRMAARLQGFPDAWQFNGTKTTRYRQIGNAFPPPVAKAVALRIKSALQAKKSLAREAA